MVMRQHLSNAERLIVFGAIGGVVAAFMPWWTVGFTCASEFCNSIGAISLTGVNSGAWGLLFLLAMAGCLVIAGARMYSRPGTTLASPEATWRLLQILTAAAAVSLGIAWLSLTRDTGSVASSGLSASGFGFTSRPGLGLYLATGSSVFAIAGTLIGIGGVVHGAAPRRPTALPVNPTAAAFSQWVSGTGNRAANPPAPYAPYGAPPPPPMTYPPVPQAPLAPMELPSWWVPLPSPQGTDPAESPPPG